MKLKEQKKKVSKQFATNDESYIPFTKGPSRTKSTRN